MLIYANEFYLEAGENTLSSFKTAVKRWLEKKIGPSFRSTKIIPFEQPFSIRDVATGINEVMIIGTPDQAPDYCLTINFRHNDAIVNGRAWHTRIGVERPTPESPLRVTVVLETSEVSPQVAEHRITPTQPGVVGAILKLCKLDPRTPGADIKLLNEETKDAFLRTIDDPQRFHTLIVVSPDDFSEEPLVDISQLQKRLVGLAQICLIPDKRIAWKLRKELPPFHTAWDGSITLISSSRFGKAMGRVFRQDEIAALEHDTKLSFEHYLFCDLTHRLNLTKSRRHIGEDVVSRRLIGFKLAKLREKTSNVEGLDEIVQSYEEDRDKARKHAEDLEFKLLAAEEANERLLEEKKSLEKQNRTLQFHLKQASNSSTNISSENSNASVEPAPVSLNEIAERISTSLSDKLILTNHAKKTLKSSPYEDAAKVWDIISLLSTTFFATFTGDLRMQDAIDELQEKGGRYAGNQSEITAGKNQGYERSYNGRKYMLNKHIGLGTARDPRHCFRLYFEWEQDEKKIIILHAGEHLDTQST